MKSVDLLSTSAEATVKVQFIAAYARPYCPGQFEPRYDQREIGAVHPGETKR